MADVSTGWVAVAGLIGTTVTALAGFGNQIYITRKQDKREERAARRTNSLQKRERLQPLYTDILRSADTALNQVREMRIGRGNESAEERAARHEKEIWEARDAIYNAVLAIRSESGSKAVVIAADKLWSEYNGFRIDYLMNRENPGSLPPEQVWGHIGTLEERHAALEAAIQAHLDALEQA